MEDQTAFDLYNKVYALESKIAVLESQLKQSKEQILELTQIKPTIPDSKLFSHKLLTRSFAAYGHVLFAQLIISLVLSVIIFLNWGVVLSSLIDALSQ